MFLLSNIVARVTALSFEGEWRLFWQFWMAKANHYQKGGKDDYFNPQPTQKKNHQKLDKRFKGECCILFTVKRLLWSPDTSVTSDLRTSGSFLELRWHVHMLILWMGHEAQLPWRPFFTDLIKMQWSFRWKVIKRGRWVCEDRTHHEYYIFAQHSRSTSQSSISASS